MQISKVLLLLFVGLISMSVTGKNAFDSRVFEREMHEIRNTVFVDYKKAKKAILELDKKYKRFDIPNVRFKIILQKIGLFSSIGDLARVKYELNKAKRFAAIYELSPKDQLYLNYYNAVYKGVNGDLNAFKKGIDQVLDAAPKNDYFLLTECNSSLARYYQFKADTIQTKKLLNKALHYCEVSSNDYLKFTTYNSVAQISFFNDDREKALLFFERSLKLAKKHQWKYAIQYCHTNLAEFYFYTQQPEKSKKLLDQVVANRNKTELRDLFQVYTILEYYFQDQNNKDSAYYYASKKNEIDDILEQEQSDDLANELDKDFQSEKQKLLLNKEIKENNYLRFLFVLIAALVIVSVIIGFFFIRQKSKSNHQLLQQKDEINEKNKIISIALSEKETLLKEIHHRVKNNLQVVSSILNLQSRNIKDEEALRIIEEGKERIFAISLIHNQLYLNKDIAFVELGAYLEKLIHQMYTSFSTNKNIQVITEIDEIELAIDTAVPVGLILCELLTNSYKHAFKDLEEGIIHIELKYKDPNHQIIVMKVWDNGIGYAENIPFLNQTSTGAEIVASFIEQLNAKFNYIQQKEGFGIVIEFSTKQNKK